MQDDDILNIEYYDEISEVEDEEDEEFVRFSEQIKRIKNFQLMKNEVFKRLSPHIVLKFGTSVREAWLNERKENIDLTQANLEKEREARKNKKKI
jgi:hypothetical protein